MRIGYLYDFEAWPTKGGNHVHAYEITRNLVELGHEVAVVDDPTMPGAVNHRSDAGELAAFVESVDGLYVRIDARPTWRWQVLSECQSLAADKPIVWEINSPANEALAYSWLGGRSLEDGLSEETFLRRLRRHVHAWRQLPRIKREERHRQELAQRVDAAICVSGALATYARKELGLERGRVLPNGGPLLTREDIAARRRKAEHSGFTVLYSGSAMYPWQGLDILFETIKLAARNQPDIHFVLAVNQSAKGLEESANVTVLRALDRDGILDAICGADVCVALHPDYPWSPYGFHNSPMKMFEYMACMRPVVASSHGQMKELLADTGAGLLCDNHPVDVLEKIGYLRDHPAEAERMGTAGWDSVHQTYNWRRNARETAALFEELLAARPGDAGKPGSPVLTSTDTAGI